MQNLSKRTARLVGFVLAAAALSACAAVGSAALTGDADTVIQACKHKVTGRLRAVASADACRTSETSISWNAQGPAGRKAPPARRAIPAPG